MVASIYLPERQSAAWAEVRLQARVVRAPDSTTLGTLHQSAKPVVLAGDLNVVPTNFDIYNPWVWRFDAVMQPETRDAYRRLLAQGWIDSARHLYPHQKIYTFWVNDRAFQRNAGFRMDFLLLSPNLISRLKEMKVDTEFRGGNAPATMHPLG